MTLGGLLKHLALLEDAYFTQRVLGRELPPAVGRARLGRRSRLGVANRCRGPPGRGFRSVAGCGFEVPRGDRGGRSRAEDSTNWFTSPSPAASPQVSADCWLTCRGVLPTRRTRRPHSGVGRRAGRRGAALLSGLYQRKPEPSATACATARSALAGPNVSAQWPRTSFPPSAKGWANSSNS